MPDAPTAPNPTTSAAPVIHDNTARKEKRQPTGKDLAKLTKDKFGDGPGSVRVDVDLAKGETKLVTVDEDGKESGGETWTPPPKEKPGVTTSPTPPAKVETPKPPAPEARSRP